MHRQHNKPLDMQRIQHDVEHSLKQSFQWFYSQTTGSTNTDLLHHHHANCIAITEHQKQGRGQANNHWQDTAGDNLLFSIALQVNADSQLALMPIRAGVAINNLLQQQGFNPINLKWPNDIFYQQKKAGGILVETSTQHQQALMVIGVGLNVNMPYNTNDHFIALAQQPIDRTPLLIACIKAIISGISTPSATIIKDFNQTHLWHKKKLQFKHPKGISNGICQGINAWGQLLLSTPQGLETHSTGHIVTEQHAVS